MKDLGWRLENLREKAGYTQKDISTMLSFSANVYGSYERGERRPTFETLTALADIYNVSLDYLIRGQEYVVKNKDTQEMQANTCELISSILKKSIKDNEYILQPEKWSQLSEEDVQELAKYFEFIIYRLHDKNT